MIIKHICKFLLGKKHSKIKIKFLSNRSREHCFNFNLQCDRGDGVETQNDRWRTYTPNLFERENEIGKKRVIIDKSIKYTSIE